jgi:hypothetical protein
VGGLTDLVFTGFCPFFGVFSVIFSLVSHQPVMVFFVIFQDFCYWFRFSKKKKK